MNFDQELECKIKEIEQIIKAYLPQVRLRGSEIGQRRWQRQ